MNWSRDYGPDDTLHVYRAGEWIDVTPTELECEDHIWESRMWSGKLQDDWWQVMFVYQTDTGYRVSFDFTYCAPGKSPEGKWYIDQKQWT
jgi:hypothetical protein